jgi:hypothetical protein
VQLFHLARIMGTSVAQIDATYGHFYQTPRNLRGLLNGFGERVYGLSTDLADGPPKETAAKPRNADERT